MVSILKNISVGSVKRIYKYFYPYVIKFRGRLGLALLSGLGVMAMDLLKPWPLKIIFDGLLFNDGKVEHYPVLSILFQKGTTWVLAATCIAIVVIAFLKGMFTYQEEIITADVGHRTVASIRRKLYNHLLKLSRSFHDHRNSGDLLVRLTGDITLLKEMLVNFIVTATGRVLVLVGMIAIMLAIDWQLTLLAIFTVPALMFSIARYTRRIRAATIRARHKEGKVASIAHESLSSISMIQAFSLENQQSERFSEYNKSNLRAGLKTRKLVAAFQRIVELLLALGSCVVMWFGVQRVLDGVLSPGDLLVFTSYMKDMYRPLRKLSQLTSRVGKATACGERILEILDMKPIIKNKRKAIAAPPFRGRISFNNVNFSYNGNDQILRDINFTIDPGQTVALVGPSGTGKTTISYLLLRFYEPQTGGIEIDGYDLRNIKLESLRKQISVIMHEPYLFGTTIWENIAMGKPDASFEDVERAARIANAHNFIINMEKGYDTVVGEAGSTLSRGQQQRIALARTAIREAPIIILDEPTTGLDAESELLVIDTLNNLMRDRTCIIIVHRFSTIKSSDRILVLDEGEIIEDGDHNTLMQMSSRYKELYSLQVAQNTQSGIHGDIL
jgi:ABC-type multidrug transport system fused ATPase/permease subunit